MPAAITPPTGSESVSYEFISLSTALLMAVVSFMAGKYWDFIFERYKYNNKYYEKIIEKRIANCEMIEHGIRPLKIKSYSNEDEKYVHNIFYLGHKIEPSSNAGMLSENFITMPMSDEVFGLAKLSSDLNYIQSFTEKWVTPELNEAFKALVTQVGICTSNKLIILQNQVFKSKDNSRQRQYTELIKIGQGHFNSIEDKVNQVEELLKLEYANITDIKKFLKHKSLCTRANAWVTDFYAEDKEG